MGSVPFFNPMIVEFGWSRTLMSGVYSLSRLEGGIEGPLVGWLIDRFGSRRVMFVGISLAGCGYILLSFVHSPLSLYLIFALTLSLGYDLGYVHSTGATVSKWFIKKRGRAISILTTGNGIGGAIFVPVIAWVILEFGWRKTAIILGVSTLLIPLPLSLLIKSTPEEMGLKPDGEKSKVQKNHVRRRPSRAKKLTFIVQPDEAEDFSVKEAVKTRCFLGLYHLYVVQGLYPEFHCGSSDPAPNRYWNFLSNGIERFGFDGAHEYSRALYLRFTGRSI